MPQSSSNSESLERLREVSREARRLSDEYRRAQPRDFTGSDERGDALRVRAERAAAELDAAEQVRRTESMAKRRADVAASGVDLQRRLRDEARARREQREQESP